MTAQDGGLGGGYRGSIDPEQLMRFIEENCASVTLEQVGERFSCHPNSVTRVLRKACGLSFQGALAQARARLACELLSRGATVEEACAGCGYASLSHFTRMFERQRGMTPGEYRRRALFGGADAD